MKPLAWMTGGSLLAWLAALAVMGDRGHPELLYGMIGPLAGAGATWIAVQRTYRAAPERLTNVLVLGFAAKMVWYGAYVAVMVTALGLRPLPFVISFTGFFIALYAMEALFLKRLTMDPRRAAEASSPRP